VARAAVGIEVRTPGALEEATPVRRRVLLSAI